MKYLAASLLTFLILGTAGTAFADPPVPDPFEGFEVELPQFPPLPPPPAPPTPGPVPLPELIPFPELPGIPFPGPGDFGLPSGSVSADLHVECAPGDPNVWVEIDNTTDDPAIATVDSSLMDAQLVAIAPHDNLIVPVPFDHIEDDTVGATVEFDGSTILDDVQSIECLAPSPSYEFNYECGSETAAVTLINEGVLPAEMGYVVAPEGPNMHTVLPGGHEEVALPHGEAEFLEIDLIADGEIMFHGVWGFDCPDVEVPAEPEAEVDEGPASEPAAVDDESPSGEPADPIEESAVTPDSGKLADDSEPVVVIVDVDGADDEPAAVTDDPATTEDAADDETGEPAAEGEASGTTGESSGSRSPLPALALVTVLGVGGVAGATAWGRR